MSRVSVLLAVHNGMPYLPAAVESIRDQDLASWQLVIVNDGSSDGTADYLDRLDDRRVEVLHQPNRGLAAALNCGLQVCRGEYLARMDADDVADQQRLAAQVQYLDQHPEVGLLGTQLQPLGPRGPGKASSLPLDHAAIDRALLGGWHAICHPTIMCRTDLLRQLGGYWANGLGEEIDLFLRFGELARLANMDRALLHYRVHGASLNSTRRQELRLHISYAIHCAQRRRQGSDPLSLEQFSASLANRPWWQRTAEWFDSLALQQFQAGQYELLSGRTLRGYTRLATAAACSPARSWNRLARTLAKRRAKQ